MPKIDTLFVSHVRIPLLAPFRTAYGSDNAVDSVLVRLTAGDLSGWGESQPFRYPTYSPEYSASVFLTVRDVLAPAIIGQEVNSGEELQARMSPFKGNYFAKGAIDLAWWDLDARFHGEPLWNRLGGRGPTVDVGADFGRMDTFDSLLAKVGEAVAANFMRIKLKCAPGWDTEMVAAVRSAYPKIVLHVDCNSAYRLDDLPMFQKLDQFDLAMVEQPLAHDDLIDHATLQQQIATPVCLDESITSADRARKAIEIGACRWINIKPGRVGGLTNAIRIHDLCQEAGIPCWVGGMLESGIGGSHNLALATLPNIKYPSDIFPSDRFFKKDLAIPEMVLSSPSRMTASQRFGIGSEPDPEQLEQLALKHATLRHE